MFVLSGVFVIFGAKREKSGLSINRQSTFPKMANRVKTGCFLILSRAFSFPIGANYELEKWKSIGV